MPVTDQRIYALYVQKNKRRPGPNYGGRGRFWLTIAQKSEASVQDCKAAVRREQERLGRA